MEKFPKCTLGTIICPGEYIVVSQDKEHLAEVKHLEDDMSKGISNAELENLNLNLSVWVAVSINSKSGYKRGIIEKKINDDTYEVFLVDYGYFIERNTSHIKLIVNQSYTKIEPLAFKVKLHGLLPINTEMVDGVEKKKVSETWSANSENFVSRLFIRNPEILVECICIQDRNVYGDLHLKLDENPNHESLRKLLCEKNFCVYSENNNSKIDCSHPSSKNSERSSSVENKKTENSYGNVNKNNQNDIESTVSYIGMSQAPKGLGRGQKLLLKLEEMTKKFPKTVVDKPGTSNSNTPSLSCSNQNMLSEEASVSCGRGKLLKTMMELNKLGKLTSRENSKSEIEESKNVSVRKTGENSLTSYKLNDKNNFEAEPESLAFEKLRIRNSSELFSKTSEVQSSAAPVIRTCSSINAFDEKDNEKESLSDLFNEQKLFSHSKSFHKFWTPLVLFEDSFVEPVNTFKELPIKLDIIKNLEKKGAFRNLSPLQRWAIPTIRKQQNLIMIGSPKTGKTLSYVVPLMDYIQEEEFFDELPSGNGPRVVIVGSSARFCESVYYLCHTLLGNHFLTRKQKSKIKILLAQGNVCDKSVLVQLTNGCDILISTPHCLVRFLKTPWLLNFERLTCLVIDEIDVVSEKPFRVNLRAILENAKISRKGNHFQKIFCGEKWSSNVESLAETYVNNYTLIITSYSEAAIYKNIKPRIYFTDKNQKVEKLLDILSEKFQGNILIVCESISEAVHVNEFLKKQGITSLIAHENIMADKLQEILKILENSSSHPVLVCTDGVLCEVQINGVQTLVHYDLPSKSKSNFFLRYSVFEGFSNSPQIFQNFKKRDKLNDILLLDEESHYQLPHIVEFISRLGGKVPEKILQKCDEICRTIEVQKVYTPLCKSLLCFGKCRNSKNCSQRHALVKALDSPRDLPNSGWVNFVILKVHEANYFSARLIDYMDLDEKTTSVFSDYLPIASKLYNFYNCEINRKPHGAPNFGDFCAVKTGSDESERFYRAQIIEYVDFDKHSNPVSVNVRLIDFGHVWRLKVIELYELPEELVQDTPLAVEVILAGIQPFDFDRNWSAETNIFAENLLTQKLESNQYWSGKIELSLNGILFLKPMMLKRILPNLGTHAMDTLVQEELIKKNMAVSNEDHLPLLFDLCSAAGLEISKNESKIPVCKQVQPDWAFFDSEFVKVKFLAARDFSTVFLQPKKFASLLEDLETDCSKEAEKLEKEKMETVEENQTFNLAKGMFCLAKYEESWNRGRIELEEEDAFSVFFVDHGDFNLVPKKTVLPISQTLLTRLPCQAIECRLIGLKSDQDCSDDILGKIYDFANDEHDIYAYVMKKRTQSKVTGGSKWEVNLVSGLGESLNKFLAEKEGVVVEESEKEYLENVIMDLSEEEIEEEEEDDLEKDSNENLQVEALKTFLEVKDEANFFSSLLRDDLFECEESRLFLQEFASKISLIDKPLTEKFKSSKKAEVAAILNNSDSDMKSTKTLETSTTSIIKIKSEVTEEENIEVEGKEKAEVKVEKNEVKGEGKAEVKVEKKVEVKVEKAEVEVEEKPKIIEEKKWGKGEKEKSNETQSNNPKSSSKKRTSKKKEKKTRKKHKKNNFNLIIRENILTPKILWSQNSSEILIKVLVENIQNFKIDCFVNNVLFRCSVNDKLYAVDVRLFGAINPQMSKTSLKPFRAEIALKKLTPHPWPRLLLDKKKPWWVGWDLESMKDTKICLIKEHIRSVKKDIEAGIIKKGIRSDYILPCSDSEMEFEDIDSEEIF